MLHELVVLDRLLRVLPLPLARLGVEGVDLLEQVVVLVQELLLLSAARLDFFLEPLQASGQGDGRSSRCGGAPGVEGQGSS